MSNSTHWTFKGSSYRGLKATGSFTLYKWYSTKSSRSQTSYCCAVKVKMFYLATSVRSYSRLFVCLFFNNIPLGVTKDCSLTQRSSSDTQVMQRHGVHVWEISENEKKESQCRYREKGSDYAGIHTHSQLRIVGMKDFSPSQHQQHWCLWRRGLGCCAAWYYNIYWLNLEL